MMTHPYFNQNPADSIYFKMNAYEISVLSDDALNAMKNNPGHYTYKLNPLGCKKKLYENDFYYCDTLIEPYCTVDDFIYFENELAVFGNKGKLDDLVSVCTDAFVYGRFHRDFKLEKEMAELRYRHWLMNLYDSESIYTLYYAGRLAGFIGYTNNKLVLHALDNQFRGKGLAKYFWSKVCKDLFAKKHHEITSSVSVANLAAMNLYISLGFKFRNALDVYHRVIQP